VSFPEFDTIVAPATPVGRSALAIVRIDGPAAPSILSLMGGGSPQERLATKISLRHDGKIVDDCVVTRFEAPRSFTGNDLVELSLHGNPVLVQRVIEICLALGARVAEPGEFTERAVLNGKLDLTQAEAVADLIHARTNLQAQLSLSNLSGLLSRTSERIRQVLLHVLSQLEAALDFSDEGYEFIGRDEAIAELESAIRDIRVLLATYERGSATTRGLNAVILGRPNAGKSSLLNRLVGSDRAIVTEVPGTTRDILRETIEIGGLPVSFADTAGLRPTEDLVEGIGIARARDAASTADLVIYLVDSTAGRSPEDDLEIAAVDPAKLVEVYTKIDLTPVETGRRGISTVSGAGMDEFLVELDRLVKSRYLGTDQSAMVVNLRQRDALRESEVALGQAIETLRAGFSEEAVAVDLYRAAGALAALTGAVATDDILAEIFSKFCIGK
jgi:tRNA modification GTPase